MSKTLTITMKANDTAEVLLYDVIGEDPFFGGISAKTFREQLKAIKAKTINLRINCPGGDVFEASAMIAALREHPARKEIDIDGVAASAASWVAMEGAVIRIAPHAEFMIHDPYIILKGGADKLRSTAERLEKLKSDLLDSYGKRAKMSREELSKAMTAETWWRGDGAVAIGFADETSKPEKMAALADLSKFDYCNVPQRPGPTPEQLAAHAQRVERLKNLAKSA